MDVDRVEVVACLCVCMWRVGGASEEVDRSWRRKRVSSLLLLREVHAVFILFFKTEIPATVVFVVEKLARIE